ncbi:hypothetical protein ACSLBF_01915 [Pseudoalteromonas sp. T1lg65]|uniref:hypothetical protein n=1 Tax=Pseudoalteromonas sp. T1lg65 TaxID=2077101 RepID=UPI003F79A57D
MKIASGLLVVLLVLLAMSWLSLPVISFDFHHLELESMMGLDWVGLELLGLIAGILAFIAVIALVSIGVIGFVAVVLVGVALTLLFNSLMLLFPILCVIGIVWLVTDKSKRAKARY